MAKKLYVAQVGLTVIRQIKFTADENLTDDELDDMAGKLAMNITTGCTDFQILGMECRKATGKLRQTKI